MKKTTEVFKCEVYEKKNGEYEVIGEYINNKTPILMRHNICGEKYMVRPDNFLNGTRCPKCFGSNVYTTKSFRDKVDEISNGEYEIISAYVNTNTKMDFIHRKCGSVFSMRPGSFISGQRCPFCANHIKYNSESFAKRIKIQAEDDFSLVGDYIDYDKTKVKIKHITCGEVFEIVPKRFINNPVCPKCRQNKKKNELKIAYISKIKDLVGDDYSVVGEYVNNKTPICMRHNVCGAEYMVRPDMFINGNRCTRCSKARRYTKEEFDCAVKELGEDEYLVVGNYKNLNTHVEFKHSKCGNVFLMRPSLFIGGSRCPRCRISDLHNTVTFKEKVYNAVGDEYEVLGEYVDYNHTKIRMRHSICGYEYEVLPSTFLQGRRCAKCAGIAKYTTETFKAKVFEIVNEEYEILGEYKNSKSRILIRHNICGNEYEVRPNRFLNGDRCPYCSKHKTYSDDLFKKKVQDLVGEEYTVLGEFVNASTKILMRHNECGHTYTVKPTTFVQGTRCPKCFKSVPYTTEEYRQKVYELVGDRYTLLSEYVNAKTSVTFRHNPCGNIYNVKPLMFFMGNRCPQCSKMLARSLPEEIVAFYISQYYRIEQSYRPDWLKLETGNNAEIDIWIPSISVGIEYDGSIHRKKSIYEKDLEKNRIIIESEYCNRLYRIRENITHEMEECSEKIKILKADDTISLTSRRGIIQLEKMIIELLAMLGVENPEVKITDQILNLCRNKVDEYYVAEGLPARRKRTGNGKSNTKIFKKRVYNLVGDEYEVVSEYNTALTDISIKHNKCNRVYTTRPNSFLSGRRCPYCARKGQYTTSIYMDRLYETVGDEYSMVGEYINSKTKVVLKHNKCGCEFQKYLSHFLARPCCPICTGKIFI